MRIISGELKGRSINFLKSSKTRPLKDKVKESIFNILQHSNVINKKVKNSNILDLYSGIGSFGIECISRGAKKATFVEQEKSAGSILKENLVKLSIFDRCKIHIDKIENFLAEVKNEKYDIFFFDPPFSDFNFLQNLEMIKKKKFFKKNHVLVIHRERGTIDKLEDLMITLETKQYGRSKIIFGIFN